MSASYDKVKSELLYDLALRKETDDEAALKLIDDPTINVNYLPEDAYHKTPLWWAAFNKRAKIAETLIKPS